MSQAKHRIDDINKIEEPTFVSRFGAVYEHSPWVAQEAWQRRPFASLDALHTVMDEVVQTAGPAQQMILIKAHPELAGRLPRSDQPTAAARSHKAEVCLLFRSQTFTCVI